MSDLPQLKFGGEMVRPVQDGYSAADPFSGVVTDIKGGFSRVGRDAMGGVFNVTATYRFDALQYLWWGAFYHTTLLDGALPFEAELALDTPVIQTYVCQIVARPSNPVNLGFYKEVTLQLQAEPVIDEAYNAAVSALLSGYGYDYAEYLDLYDQLANVWMPESLS